MRVQKEHRIELSQARYFELMFDAETARRLNVEAMNAESYEVVERNVEGDAWTLRSKVTPKDNMPGFLKKLIGTTFTYEEQLSHEKGSDRASATVIPGAMRDRTKMSYVVQVIPEGDNACRRIIDWEIEVKMFGVGGQIEKFAAGEMERGMEASARFFNNLAKQA